MTDIMTDVLPKPCPCCGHEKPAVGTMRTRTNKHEIAGYRVVCRSCGLRTDWHGSQKKALAVWGRRRGNKTGKTNQREPETSRKDVVSGHSDPGADELILLRQENEQLKKDLMSMQAGMAQTQKFVEQTRTSFNEAIENLIRYVQYKKPVGRIE